MCCLGMTSLDFVLIYYDCISIFRVAPDLQRCDQIIQARFPKATFQILMELAVLENLL